MNEEWKTIIEFDTYEISSEGRVRNKQTRRILKPYDTNGYVRVDMRKNGIVQKYMVHRLVAIAFIPNPNGMLEVHHKNHIRNDNRRKNLEWVTGKMNQLAMWIYHLEQMGYKIIPPQ